MTTPLLTTKFHIPRSHPEFVLRQRLIDRVNAGARSKLVLVSAPAGFGKSTLLSTWVQQAEQHVHVAWLSLDEGDSDLIRFLTYMTAALQTADSVGENLLGLLRSRQPPSAESFLTILLNEIAGIS